MNRLASQKWRCCCDGCNELIPVRKLFCRKHHAMTRSLPEPIRRGLDAARSGRSDAALHALDQAVHKIAVREGLRQP